MNMHFRPAAPRKSQRRVFLEGVVLGMLLSIAVFWIAEPIVTGNWSLL